MKPFIELEMRIQNYNFEFEYKGRIREYVIKQDPISKKWLFIYLTNRGTYRTVIFGNKMIEYDREAIRYEATPLSEICFYKNTIYAPAGGKIIGINYQKNQQKEFMCKVVLENSKLQFDGQKFTIVNEDKIYAFGG